MSSALCAANTSAFACIGGAHLGTAIAALKAEGKCPSDTQHRHIKYFNNVIEADHGKLKRQILPTLGFKSRKTAYATIKGFEKGQAKAFQTQPDIKGEVRLIERAFGLGADMLSEVFDYHRAEIDKWAA